MLLNIRNLVGLSQKDLWEGIRGAEVVNLVQNFGASLKLSRGAGIKCNKGHQME